MNKIEDFIKLAIDGDEYAAGADEKLTELGNAKRLVRQYGKDLRFVHLWRKWMIWQDGHWRRDEDGAVMRLAKATVEAMLAEAVTINDETKRNAMLRHALASQKAKQLHNMVTLAQTEKAVVLSPTEWDADPMLLGVQNGVIDLRSGAFREASRDDYVTKVAGTSYDEQAQCPNWEAFLSRIFSDDQELIAYVQRATGYMLTGSTAEELLFVLWGGGANGKSTFRETLFALLGDYAMGADASLLITKKQGGTSVRRIRPF